MISHRVPPRSSELYGDSIPLRRELLNQRRAVSYSKHINRLPVEVTARTIGIAEWVRRQPTTVTQLTVAEALERRACWALDNGMVRQLACGNGVPLGYDVKPVLDERDVERATEHLLRETDMLTKHVVGFCDTFKDSGEIRGVRV